MREDDATLAKIRHRWAESSAVLTWNQIPPSRRERVLAELEESARQIGETDRQSAADFVAAADVLDSAENLPLLELLKQAQADIHELLARVAKRD